MELPFFFYLYWTLDLGFCTEGTGSVMTSDFHYTIILAREIHNSNNIRISIET